MRHYKLIRRYPEASGEVFLDQPYMKRDNYTDMFTSEIYEAYTMKHYAKFPLFPCCVDTSELFVNDPITGLNPSQEYFFVILIDR